MATPSVDVLEQTLSEAQSQLQVAESELSSLQVEDQRLSVDFQRLQSDKNQLFAEETKLKAELALLSKEKAALDQEALEENDSEAGLRTQILEKEKEIKAFAKRFEELKSASDVSEAEYDKARKSLFSLEGELLKLRERTAQSQLSLQHIKEKIAKLRHRLETKDIEKAQVLLNVKSKEFAYIEDIRRLKDEIERAKVDAEARIKESKDKEKTLTAELASLKSTVSKKPKTVEIRKEQHHYSQGEETLDRLRQIEKELEGKDGEIETMKKLTDERLSAGQIAILLLTFGTVVGIAVAPVLEGFLRRF